jgi:two-component system chemotaxis response regulator CheY
MPTQWQIQEAADGKEALATLDVIYDGGGKIDLVLLDWNMPKMLGIDCLKSIKTSEKFKDIRVIIVTSDGDKSNVIAAVKAGAADFLVKPIDPVILQDKIWKLFHLDA